MINRTTNITRIGQVGAWLFIGLLVWLSIWKLTPSNILYTDDAAFSIGLAKSILRGEVLLQGVPSHLGGRNLGPWYNYLVAGCLALAGQDLTWTFRLLALVNLFGFGLAAWLALHIAPAVSKWWAIVGLCLVLIGAQYLWVIRVPWMPNFLLVPATLTIALSWLVISRGPKYLIPFGCAATVCVHTHMSSAPMLFGLGAITILSSLGRAGRHKWRTTHVDCKFWHCAWLAIFAALWLPLLVYEVRFGGNLNRLVNIHSKVIPVRAGFSAVSDVFVRFFKFFLLGDSSLNSLLSPLPGYFCYLLLGLAALFWARHLVRASTQIKCFWLAILTGTLFTLIALARLRPPIHVYYLNSFLGALALWAGVVCAEAAHALFYERRNSIFLRSCSLTLLVLVGLILVRSGKYNYDLYSGQPFPKIATLAHAAEVASVIEADRQGEKNVAIFVRGKQSLRAGAFYSLLDGDYFPPMMYADKCIELPSVRAYNSLNVKNKTTNATLAYVMHCPAVADISSKKYWNKMNKWWAIDRQVPLAECVTCVECSLTRLKRSAAPG